MESRPDLIKVSVSHREEIFATRADLHVTVKGSSVISGNEALKKAKEVNQLIEALSRLGVKEEAVKLQGVHIEVASGALLKSSNAMYRLKICCEKLDQLAEMLDVIASQKNATLERVEWKYNEDAARENALNSAIEKAKSKAQHIAASLGVKLLGVYDFIENVYDQEVPVPQFAAQAMSNRSLGAVASAPEPNLEMEIQHNKTIQVNVDIWYHLSAF